MVKDNIMTLDGINYQKPKVLILGQNGIGIPEIAARTCYDSFDSSSNNDIKKFGKNLKSSILDQENINNINNIEESELLEDLAWAYHHYSILEHSVLSFYIQGTSRGVLQEHARHRIQSISVRSTRYTMSSVINIYLVFKLFNLEEKWFIEQIDMLNLFVTVDKEYNYLQIKDILNKLSFQNKQIWDDKLFEASIAKSNLENFLKSKSIEEAFKILNLKKKRNVGDAFKHIVNDNWKVDMVVSFNLRSLKNYFKLRNSGAAYFQIRELAQQMIKVTPKKYKKLILKNF